MDKKILQGLLEQVKKIALKAGKKASEIYHTGDFTVDFKNDDSPLTQADLASHRVIVEALSTISPSLPVLSEEAANIDFSERKAWSQYWLVDPLDGTKEFIKRNGEYTVNIALIEGGTPILGVVYAPEVDTLYAAAEGLGAYVTRNDCEQPIHVAAAPTDLTSEPLKVVASRSHAGEQLNDFLASVASFELVSMGSSLKLCLVAEGKAHLYPRLAPTMEWDTAAAHAVVLEAGGTVTDLSGRELRYNKENLLNPFFMVAGNPGYPWQDCFNNTDNE